MIIPNRVIPRNTFVIEIDACRRPMFLVDVDRNKHFRASKDVYVLCLACTLVLSVFDVAPKVGGGKENFFVTVNSLGCPSNCPRVR